MPFFAIIWKNVLRRKLRSALAAFGIMLAIAAAVALVSFAVGLRNSAIETYQGHGIDLLVLRAGVTERLTSNLNESIAEQLAALDGVAAVNPSLTDMVSFGQSDLIGVPVHGWPAGGFAARSLDIVQGRALDENDTNSVVFGVSLAEGLVRKMGETVEIEGQSFRVVGIYQGANFFENASAVVPLKTLQRLMDRPNQVTELQIALTPDMADDTALAALQANIAGMTDSEGNRLGLTAIPTAQYVTSSSEIELAGILANVSSIVALAIGSIGILNTMVMSVSERMQELGALRAIGWRRARVLRMILGESLVVSLAGGVAGIVAAAVVLRLLSQAPMVRGWLTPSLQWQVAVLGLLLAILMAVIGGLYPAYRASCCDPAEALRHE